MSNEVARRPEQAVATRGEFSTEGMNLADALGALGAQMQSAIDGMRPDDVLIEVDHQHENGRSQTRMRFRAYTQRE
jgi:hypothetical protein